MMMKFITLLLATVLVFFLHSDHTEAGLDVGFYRNKCSSAEYIIRDEVAKAFGNDRGIAPGLIRLHFHDCFVRGCDGSILIDSTPGNSAEKDGPPNGITLRGLEVIDKAKTRLENSACKGIVSCADILAYAARDATVITGGPYWDVPAGRRDGRISRALETSTIPAPFQKLDQITKGFTDKNLTQEEMVTLLGAHTIGRSHCTSFSNRLYNFNSQTSQDPTLNEDYADQLKRQCPRNAQGSVSPTDVVFMNQTPNLFEQSYYRDVLGNRGLFTSDQTLLDSATTSDQVKLYAVQGFAWRADFAEAMIRLSEIEVLTGNQGEIRADCRVINH